MKKRFVCGAVLAFALASAVFAGRREIDDVYKAFEAFVVEAENLAKKPSVAIGDFSGLQEKAEAVEAKAAKVRDDRDYTAADGQRFAALEARFRTAWDAIMKKLKY
jgi:hypothetical protein